MTQGGLVEALVAHDPALSRQRRSAATMAESLAFVLSHTVATGVMRQMSHYVIEERATVAVPDRPNRRPDYGCNYG